MVNGNAANQDQQPQLSEDESVSPYKYNGRISCLSPNRELGQEVLSIDLKCGLETSDGDKVDGNKIALNGTEHNEEDVNVTVDR